jgi:hypothetical protein
MKRIGLIFVTLCVAILDATTARAQNCSDLQNRICVLDDVFIPNPGGVDKTDSLSCTPANRAPIGQIAAIITAINQAPQKVQADLCGVTSFFVSNSQDWGRWENPQFINNPATPAKTQIVVKSQDVNDPYSPSSGNTVTDRQNEILHELRNSSRQSLSNFGQHLPPASVHGEDHKTLGLLYTLAHELAHIWWHKNAAAKPIVNTVCDEDPNFSSWQSAAADPNKRWTALGDDFGTHSTASVKKPRQVQNSADLLGIYKGGFVTALAAASFEEDFVESYAIRVLMEACPSCIYNIRIGGSTHQVNHDHGNPELTKKFACVYKKYIQ